MTLQSRARLFVAVMLVAALAACGRGDDEVATQTTSTTDASATTAAPATGAPGAPTSAAPASTAAPTTRAGATATPAPPRPDACSVGAQPAPPAGGFAADYATALAFAPDGRLFFAERSGTIRVFQDGKVRRFAGLDVSTSGERGLLGLAIGPDFGRDRAVFAFSSDPDGSRQRVTRWTDCAGTGRDPRQIVSLPAGPTCCHKGGRIAFGPDGKLYVTLGDQHTSRAAQDTNDVRGKILRYNADGTVPADNPFGAGNPVWAFGFRNPFGIAISPSGQMAVTDNGPSGDSGSPGTGYDTVHTSVVKGGGYQWPNCYGYGHRNRGATSCGEGQHEPDWSSERETVVPTGATFVDAAGPAPYAGRLVFCTYSDGMKILTPGTPRATVAQGPVDCRLDVKQGPDRALYYSSPDRIHRLAR